MDQLSGLKKSMRHGLAGEELTRNGHGFASWGSFLGGFNNRGNTGQFS